MSYLQRDGQGRVFHSLEEARRTGLQPGDSVLLRDMAQLASPETWSTQPERGKWHLRPYRLTDGQSGRLLDVNIVVSDDPHAGVPPAFTISLDLPGWYALWIGVPHREQRPRLGFPLNGGVDMALDSDPVPVHVGVDRGTRKGRVMGPVGVEIMSYWKSAPLDGRSLRIAVPHGTYFSFPWGLTRGSISALRLVRLSDEQVEAYRRDISDPSTKRVIINHDGFSHYWSSAEPGDAGNLIDARFVQQYRDSDVGKLVFQSPATGVASWPSRVTDLLGEGAPDEVWARLRAGDFRAVRYVRWAVANGYEGMRVVGDLCRRAGIEFHASLRMNLFFDDKFCGPFDAIANGSWWRKHPEVRKPGSLQIDYAHPVARRFVIDLLRELAEQYVPDGINLDFTRWPPVADPARHDFDVLTSFIAEVWRMLEEVGRTVNRRIMLSAFVVDGYQAHATLAEQKIDLEAWLASGCLDFICVQAWEQAKYLAIARRHGVPYYSLQDNTSFRTPGDDPEWAQEAHPDHDPGVGEELEEQPHLNSTLDPPECDAGVLEFHRLGVDGICWINTGMRSLGRLGHVEEMAERARTGQVWGQEIGPGIQIEGAE